MIAKRLLTAFTACAVAFGVILPGASGSYAAPAADAGSPFTDLGRTPWAADSIGYLAERGTVAGISARQFGPDRPVTRAQAVTFLVREKLGRELPDAVPAFTDVTTAHPFYREIAAAAAAGLAGGYADGTFRPDRPVSRAETAALLSRAYKLQKGDMPPGTATDTAAHWASGAIALLATNGLVSGYADGTFRPNRAVTRAEYAVFLTRVIRHKRAAAIAAQDWDELLTYMPLKEQIGQMLMPDIRQWQGKATTSVHAGLREVIRTQQPGGFILFGKNIVDARQLTAFTRDLQLAAGDIPFFLSIDQEGGVVKRIPGGTNLPGQMALGASGDEALARAAGRLTGTELEALGLNVNFAPVLDVNSNPDNPIIGIRSFGSDANQVSRLGIALMDGMRQAGVIAGVKHFPGHGDTDVDSHLGLPLLTHDRERLDRVELKPFRDAIAAGVPMIMTAHVAFPAVDDRGAVSRKDGSRIPVPATLSKTVLTGLLREELGYEGVIISDAFTMDAVAEHFGERESVVLAAAAGVDIILMPQDTGTAQDALLEAAKRGELRSADIAASVKRILALKAAYGLFEPQAPLDMQLARVDALVGADAHRKIEREIAERAVTLLAGKDGRPQLIRTGDHVVIAADDREIAAELQDVLRAARPKLTVETVLLGSTSPEATFRNADYVLLASYQFRNRASRYDWSPYQNAVGLLNDGGKRYTLLSLGNPYELRHLSDVESAVAVYGKQAPNMAAGVRALLGELEPAGRLAAAQ